MELMILSDEFTVCKIESVDDVKFDDEIYFFSKTNEELSLMCRTKNVPVKTVEREDNWKGFKIQGVLDFSLIGILAKISNLLAENQISIFAVSTYNTDYIFVKSLNFEKTITVLKNNGYTFTE